MFQGGTVYNFSRFFFELNNRKLISHSDLLLFVYILNELFCILIKRNGFMCYHRFCVYNTVQDCISEAYRYVNIYSFVSVLFFFLVLVVNQFVITNVSHSLSFTVNTSYAWIDILFNRDLSLYVYNHFHFLFSCIIHVFHQLYSVLTININRTFKLKKKPKTMKRKY